MKPSQTIDALGGTAEVARMCEVEMAAVSQWRRNGIPNARLMFLKLARPDVFDPASTASQYPIPGHPIDGATVRETIGKARPVGDQKGHAQ